MYRVFVEARESGRVLLPSDEAHHLVKVRRCSEGELFLGFHPESGWLRCRLEREAGQWYGLVLEELDENRESPLQVTLGQALIKKDRFEWVVQKAVELGVAEIVPLITARSELKLARNPEKRLQRWQRILRESVKQSGRTCLPRLRDPIQLDALLAGSLPETRLVLDEAASEGLRQRVAHTSPPPACLLLVGPEGGWDQLDRERWQAAGCSAVKLGPRILRTETAPLAALAILQYLWGDF